MIQYTILTNKKLLTLLNIFEYFNIVTMSKFKKQKINHCINTLKSNTKKYFDQNEIVSKNKRFFEIKQTLFCWIDQYANVDERIVSKFFNVTNNSFSITF